MNFKKESRKLAEAMGAEHFAMGVILEDIERRRSGSGIPDDAPDYDIVDAARIAHADVEFQKKRVEAARGEAVKATA